MEKMDKKSKKRKELIGASLLIISLIFATPVFIFALASLFYDSISFGDAIIPQLVVFSMAFTGFILLKDDKAQPEEVQSR